jgi:hypothetical protein
MTIWPPLDFIRTRKPWVFFRFLTLGRNVGFMVLTHFWTTMLIEAACSVKVKLTSAASFELTPGGEFGYNCTNELLQDWG